MAQPADADLLCLEDYDKGVLPPGVCARLIEVAREKDIPILVDPARLRDYSKYSGATALKSMCWTRRRRWP